MAEVKLGRRFGRGGGEWRKQRRRTRAAEDSGGGGDFWDFFGMKRAYRTTIKINLSMNWTPLNFAQKRAEKKTQGITPFARKSNLLRPTKKEGNEAVPTSSLVRIVGRPRPTAAATPPSTQR